MPVGKKSSAGGSSSPPRQQRSVQGVAGPFALAPVHDGGGKNVALADGAYDPALQPGRVNGA